MVAHSFSLSLNSAAIGIESQAKSLAYKEKTMAPGIENRLHPRIPITLPTRMVTATGLMEGETENVSLHGAFIRCQKPLEPGERLFVIVKLPSNPSGTKRDLDKAREMYEKAKAKGHPKADAALSKLNKQQSRVTKQAQKEKAAQDRAAKEKAAKEKAAQQRAAKERAAKEKAAQQRAAKEKARKDAKAKTLAEERNKARAELERQKAAHQQAARETAAREKAAKEKAKRDALAKKQQEEAARRAAQHKAAQQKAAQQKLAQQKAAQDAARKKAEKEAEKKGFKSDPCQGAAARVMSTCKK